MNCGQTATTRIRSLAELLPQLATGAHAATRISGLCLDSRQVRPGDAFIALRGGVAFCADAVQRGAAVILLDSAQPRATVPDLPGVPLIEVAELQTVVGDLAACFFGDPSTEMAVIGVTGTNGKTTCTQLISQAFAQLEQPCGVVGTLGWGLPGELSDTGHTTPDAVTTQRVLATLRDQGAAAVAMEVSSHALKQNRVSAVHFATAVFTNLTHDHLDYHGTLEDYGASKKRLFESAGLRHAVLNVDDAFCRGVLADLPSTVQAIGYSIAGQDAQVRATDANFSINGLSARVQTPWGEGEIRAPLLGRFNLGNLLAVLSVLCLHGVALPRALAALSRLAPVPGRMERIEQAGGPLVVVDYAHTPDALEHSLRALRLHCSGRLWCVFGCGGDRDRTKRPLMGRIAWEHADELVISSDNPRSEPAETIIEQICTGIPEPGVRRESNRTEAIRVAINAAGPGDCVLIAGKGHENYQETGGVREPFCDATVARAALNSKGQAS